MLTQDKKDELRADIAYTLSMTGSAVNIQWMLRCPSPGDVVALLDENTKLLDGNATLTRDLTLERATSHELSEALKSVTAKLIIAEARLHIGG